MKKKRATAKRRTGARARRALTSSPRLIDTLARNGEIDSAYMPLLEEIHHFLSKEWDYRTDVVLDTGQALCLFSLLGRLFAPARPESAEALNRSGNIALDWWYRTEWLGQHKKKAMAALCEDWKLGRTQIIDAKRKGHEHAERLVSIGITGSAQPGERLLNIEGFLANLRKKQGGGLRG